MPAESLERTSVARRLHAPVALYVPLLTRFPKQNETQAPHPWLLPWLKRLGVVVTRAEVAGGGRQLP